MEKVGGGKNGQNGFFDFLRRKGLKNDENYFFPKKYKNYPLGPLNLGMVISWFFNIYFFFFGHNNKKVNSLNFCPIFKWLLPEYSESQIKPKNYKKLPFTTLGRVWYDFSCKKCRPNCNTFHFMNFYSQRGDPLVMPLTIDLYFICIYSSIF